MRCALWPKTRRDTRVGTTSRRDTRTLLSRKSRTTERAKRLPPMWSRGADWW
nr:MAG TPA: hypothetical protein [Caudoviricetes sp.]